jgi:hypothetical protein
MRFSDFSIPNYEKIIKTQKNMFKVKKSQKLVPDGICRSTQNHEKMIGTPGVALAILFINKKSPKLNFLGRQMKRNKKKSKV